MSISWATRAIGPPLRAAARAGNGKAARQCIEINNASLLNYPDRSHDACLAIATACRDLGVQVSVSSDAHSAFQIGCLDAALALLESISFPPELIVNRTVESFEAFLHR